MVASPNPADAKAEPFDQRLHVRERDVSEIAAYEAPQQSPSVHLRWKS
jgi:hypothetical protein